MESANKDEILSNFIAITQCSNDEATRYLEAAHWNAQTAMEIFFDHSGSQVDQVVQPNNPTSTGNTGMQTSHDQDEYESDDESPIQNVIQESLRTTTSATVAKGDTTKKPDTSSKFGTLSNLQKDEEEDSDEEGQAFYAGGSERSGQQIIGPPKGKNTDKKVTKIFDAARKQGATELDEDNADQSNRKKEQIFGGVGYRLGDDNTPSRSYGQSLAAQTTAAASNRLEQVPLRFFSNGFTVADGELRKFEDNKEFMEYIKRGEVPPELRTLTSGGRQVEVRLEDHRGEEYKPIAPQFKAFGGAGHMLGSPTPNIATSTTGQTSIISSTSTHTNASSTSNDIAQLEKLAEQQLKSSSSSTTMRFRLPDYSTPLRIVIDLNRTLADVRQFLNANISSLQSNQFEFIEPPAAKIKRETENKSISDAKLSNATLIVRRS